MVTLDMHILFPVQSHVASIIKSFICVLFTFQTSLIHSSHILLMKLHETLQSASQDKHT